MKETRHTLTPQIFHLDTSETINDVRLSDELIKPVFDGCIVAPEFLGSSMTTKRKKNLIYIAILNPFQLT